MNWNGFIRYARWSLGFVDPPIEIAGAKDKCVIRALNDRGSIILPAIIRAMNKLQDDDVLSDVIVSNIDEKFGSVEVSIVPLGEVGSFSEEERSRQVCLQEQLQHCDINSSQQQCKNLYRICFSRSHSYVFLNSHHFSRWFAL